MEGRENHQEPTLGPSNQIVEWAGLTKKQRKLTRETLANIFTHDPEDSPMSNQEDEEEDVPNDVEVVQNDREPKSRA